MADGVDSGVGRVPTQSAIDQSLMGSSASDAMDIDRDPPAARTDAYSAPIRHAGVQAHIGVGQDDVLMAEQAGAGAQAAASSARPSTEVGGSAGGDGADGADGLAGGSSGAGGGGSSAYVSRDAQAKKEEEAGALQFRVIRNDGVRHNMIWLTQAKNIFAAQLPKMPREYIARLVFDRKHRTLIALKRDRVVGGICFRPFVPQKFAEIAFCAITSSEQVKVRGVRL
jgi:hypothetical protein